MYAQVHQTPKVTPLHNDTLSLIFTVNIYLFHDKIIYIMELAAQLTSFCSLRTDSTNRDIPPPGHHSIFRNNDQIGAK